MIKVGIIQTHRQNEKRPFQDQYYFVTPCIKQIEKQNAYPLGILMEKPSEEYLSIFDGFLLPGCTKITEAHIRIIHYAVSNNKPILAICGGMQAIGLYDYITNILNKTELKEIIETFNSLKSSEFLMKVENHNKQENIYQTNIEKTYHKIYIQKNTKLYNIYKTSVIKQPSIHNYVIKDISPSFIVSALSEEGYIEALEHPTKCIIAVQFHPELEKKNAHLFKYFVDCLKK